MPVQKKFKQILISAVIGVIFLVNTSNAWVAMSLTFSGLPSSVNEDDTFEVDISLVDAPTNRIYHFRAALYEDGKTNYFGYTYNHLNQWHNSPGDHTKFLEITTNSEGSWSGKLKAKADLDSTYFKGAGDYKFKIGRYTEGGSLSWSNNTDSITINHTSPPSPTPTPSPSPSPESEPTPTPSPSPTPKVSVKPTTTKKTAVVGNSNSHNSEDMLLSSESGRILGIEKPEAFEATESEKGKNPYLLSIVLVILGLGLLGGTGVVFIKNAKYNKKHEKDGEI